jgi:exosortase
LCFIRSLRIDLRSYFLRLFVEPQPLSELTRSRSWRFLVLALLLGVVFAFHNGLQEMVAVWYTQADYSHGFLVPLVAAYLLYARRESFPPLIEWPDPLGLVPLVAGVGLSIYSSVNYAREFCHGFGFVLAMVGVVLLTLGRPGLKWAWPALAFLVFMVKLPDQFEVAFAFKLRQIATECSNFVLQTLGYPSYISGPGGTVIAVGDVRLGVEWACSGLSMLLTFVAVGTACALMMTQRPVSDRIVVFVSAIPIAILSNIIRISLTALVYIAAGGEDNTWKWIGDRIVHDLAGWLMMPLALGFMWLELKIIDWLFVNPPPPDRDSILKNATQAAAAKWFVPEREPVVEDPDLAPKKSGTTAGTATRRSGSTSGRSTERSAGPPQELMNILLSPSGSTPTPPVPPPDHREVKE